MAIFYTDTASINRLEVTGGLQITGSSNIVNVRGSGPKIFTISGSSGGLLEIGDITPTDSEVFVISSASIDLFKVFNNRTISVFSSLTVTGSLDVNGPFTASLRSGYVWVGDNNKSIRQVATSSFGGGGGGGTPGGADTNVQFNDGGTFNGVNNFTFNKVTNTAKVHGSGSALLLITGSRGPLLTVSDAVSNRTTLATISSGNTNVFTFTTSSLLVTGSVDATIYTEGLYYGRIVATPNTTQNNYSPTGWNDADPSKATTINLSVGASIKITGLAGGAAGRVAVLKNTSTDRLIILEDESASSTAANRFDLRNPVFLLPNGSVTLIYDGVDSRWQPLASSGGIGFGAFFDNYDDFIGVAATFGTTATEVGRYVGIGSGGGASGAVSNYLINTTEKPFGVYRITPGTTTTGRALLGAGPTTGGATFTEAVLNSVVPARGQAVFLCRLAVEALSTSGDEFQIFAGFQDAVSTNVTDGVYWQYIRTASTAWQGATANNGTRTATGAAGPTVDTNYIWLGIYINPTWTRATYFYSTDSITWVMAGEQTANIPTTRNTGVGVTMNKSAGTNVRNCSIDLMAIRYDIARG